MDHPENDIEIFYQVNPEQKNIKIRRIRFALTQQQRNDLLNCALQNNSKHYRIIKTQLATGMRIKELLNLSIAQVNFQAKEIEIKSRSANRYVSAFSTKTKHSNRIIPMNNEILRVLRTQIDKRKHGYVFESNKGGNISVRHGIRIVNKYAKKAKSIGKTIGSHALRRTYASFLLNNGVKIGKISRILGHASIKTTMEYLYDITDTSSFDEIRNAV